MKILLFSISSISLLLLSCGQPSNEKSNEQTESSLQDKHQHGKEVETIELNNGKKWKVDTNMLSHIRKMENEVFSFSTNEVKDYASLAKKLQTNIELLTSNCTMQGKAHDELHKWLVPYIDIVHQLSEANIKKNQLDIFLKIQESFVLFNGNFN